MENLQYAILAQTNPTPDITPEIRAQTKTYCQSIIEQNRKNSQFFFDLLQSSANVYMKIWAIGALSEISTQYYGEYDATMRNQVHEYYFQILERNYLAILSDVYTTNSYANLFCLILRQDFPEIWPTAFTRLFSLLNLEICTTNETEKMRFISKSYLST